MHPQHWLFFLWHKINAAVCFWLCRQEKNYMGNEKSTLGIQAEGMENVQVQWHGGTGTRKHTERLNRKVSVPASWLNILNSGTAREPRTQKRMQRRATCGCRAPLLRLPPSCCSPIQGNITRGPITMAHSGVPFRPSVNNVFYHTWTYSQIIEHSWHCAVKLRKFSLWRQFSPQTPLHQILPRLAQTSPIYTRVEKVSSQWPSALYSVPLWQVHVTRKTAAAIRNRWQWQLQKHLKLFR